MTETSDPEPTVQVPVSLPTRERIAEAIYGGIHDWSELSEWNQKAYLARADAVLALLSQPTPSAEPPHPRAQPIGVVARSVVHTLLTEAESDDIALWEDYPEIGENDWDEVIAAARALAPSAPSDAEYRAAYAALDLSTIRDVTPPKDAS